MAGRPAVPRAPHWPGCPPFGAVNGVVLSVGSLSAESCRQRCPAFLAFGLPCFRAPVPGDTARPGAGPPRRGRSVLGQGQGAGRGARRVGPHPCRPGYGNRGGGVRRGSAAAPGGGGAARGGGRCPKVRRPFRAKDDRATGEGDPMVRLSLKRLSDAAGAAYAVRDGDDFGGVRGGCARAARVPPQGPGRAPCRGGAAAVPSRLVPGAGLEPARPSRPTRFKLVVSAFHHPGTGLRDRFVHRRAHPALPRTRDEPIQGHPPNSGSTDRCCLILLATDGASASHAPLRSALTRGLCAPEMTETRRSTVRSPALQSDGICHWPEPRAW